MNALRVSETNSIRYTEMRRRTENEETTAAEHEAERRVQVHEQEVVK